MSINSIEIEIVSTKEIEKLEQIKILLTEIKSLRDEIFGKHKKD